MQRQHAGFPLVELFPRFYFAAGDTNVGIDPERSGFPSRAGLAGSNHLPWALLRILQAIPKIKRAPSGSGRAAARGRGGVCSKDARGAFKVYIPITILHERPVTLIT
jgi:hypothetical protein